MNIWIGYASCGSGHKKAAEAILDVFDNKQDVFYFNFLDYGASFIKIVYECGYRIVAGYFPPLWQAIFNIYSLKPFRSLLSLVHLIIFRKFISFIIESNPETVISTHFFLCGVISLLKQRNLIDTKLITVITDFEVHPLWINKYTDYYVVASRETSLSLEAGCHIEKDKIKVWGMPLRRGFFTVDESYLENEYEKPKGLFTLFLFSSDLGIGPLKRVIKEFYKYCGLLVIYGRNATVKNFIDSLKDAKYLLSFDYKEEIWELMHMCDLVITKAGGLSVSECIAERKPMILMHSYRGQEEGNVRFVTENGLGFRPKTHGELVRIVNEAISNHKRISKMKDNLNKVALGDCALRIKELALSIQ